MVKEHFNKSNMNAQEIWTTIRNLKAPTNIPELIKKTKLPFGVVLKMVGRMKLAGLVSIDKSTKPHVIKIVKDVGRFCPHLDAEGNKKPPTDEDRMWMAMKALKSFTNYDLRLATDAKETAVRKYTNALSASGYLIKTKGDPVSGKKPRANFRFKSTADTGPLSPMACRGKVFDRNQKKVVWVKPAIAEQENGGRHESSN